MFNLVLYVVFIILKVKANETATENPEVRLWYSKNGNESYTVWKDKPLTIVIEGAYPRYVWCRSSYAGTVDYFIPSVEFSNNVIAILSVKNVMAEMSTMWACTVLQNYQTPGTAYPYKGNNYNAKDLYFNLHVRGANAVTLTANSRSLTYVTTNLSVNYDGEVSYTYAEGEDLEISCKKPQDLDKTSTLHLEYYDAAGILLFQTKSREKNPHLFRIVFKSNNNNSYLDCVRVTESPRREYRYRTTFLKKKGDLQAATLEHAIILTVNGEELTTVFNKDSSYDDYIFRYIKYIDGDILNIMCLKKDRTVRGTLRFCVDNKPIKVNPILKDEPYAFTSVNVSESSNKNLTCGIDNTDVLQTVARILFLNDEQRHDVRIQGLARNNIMYQYTNDDNRWTTEYQYSVNDTLELTCEFNIGFKTLPPQKPAGADFFRWTFEDIPHDSPAKQSTNYRSIKRSQQTFSKTLDATHNTRKFRCIYFPHGMDQSYVNRSVEVIFRLKPESDKGEKTTSGEDPKMPIVPIAVSVGAAIGIITVICLVLWRKRTKRTHLIESEYDNLSNQNDSPIPAFPSQWETNCDDSHYAKIDEGVMEENDTYTTDTDKLYRIPYNRQSNTSENHYTEIDDHFRPKPAGLAVNWNSAYPSNFNKEKDTPKGTPSHKPNNTTQNNFCDSEQGTYDKLRHDNLPINKSNVQKTGKTVTFRQMSNDLRPGLNNSEGTSRQHCGNNDRRIKQNSDGHYANVSQDIYMQPGNLQKEPNYENNFLKNEKFENNVYAEPYGDLEINLKNDFYG